MMFGEAVSVLQAYGWAALLLFISTTILIKYITSLYSVWIRRDYRKTYEKSEDIRNALIKHQFFHSIEYLSNNEIYNIKFKGMDSSPVKERILRKLLEIKIISMKKAATKIVNEDLEQMSPNQWALYVKECMSESDEAIYELANKDGIPSSIIRKFTIWKNNNFTLLNSYISDLAISEVYTTNTARTNTLLYLLNLKLITFIGDAERDGFDINGEASGLKYNGEEIE